MARPGRLLLSACFVVSVAVPAASAGQQETSVSSRAEPAASPFQQGSESIETSADAERDILLAVLRFYRPSGRQSRWLERDRLPVKPRIDARPLPHGTMTQLIGRLGAGRFCSSVAMRDCRSTSGGGLMVSPVYRTAEDRARVVVRFESAWPYAPTVTSMQVFLLTRIASGWRVERRQPASRQGS